MSTKRTEWIPATVSPSYRGTYEVKNSGTGRIEKHYWMGKRWIEWVAISDSWRGLLKQPRT